MYESELEAFKDRHEILKLRKEMIEVQARIEARKIENEMEEVRGKIADIENRQNRKGQYDY